jgi:hypothetical protein
MEIMELFGDRVVSEGLCHTDPNITSPDVSLKGFREQRVYKEIEAAYCN